MIKPVTQAVHVVNRWKDVPQAIKDFGKCPVSEHYSPDKGIEEHPIPLNGMNEKMYPFDNDNEMGYCVWVHRAADEFTRQLAYDVISSLSIRGCICRYDLPDKTLVYISWHD